MSMTLRNRQLNVNRQELIKKLKENLERHTDEYKQAVLDYHDAVSLCAAAMVTNIRAVNALREDPHALIKKLNLTPFKFPEAPVSHEKEYQRAIAMLEFSVDETLIIDEDLFNAYVLNEWSWSHHFLALNASYKA